MNVTSQRPLMETENTALFSYDQAELYLGALDRHCKTYKLRKRHHLGKQCTDIWCRWSRKIAAHPLLPPGRTGTFPWKKNAHTLLKYIRGKKNLLLSSCNYIQFCTTNILIGKDGYVVLGMAMFVF